MRFNSRISVYFLGTGINGVSKFITLALLTRFLEINDFAMWALAEPILLVGLQVALLGTNYGLFLHISQDKKDFFWVLNGTLSWCKLPILSAASIGIGLFLALNFSFRETLFLATILGLESIMELFLSAFRAAEKPIAFVSIQTFQSLGILASLFLLFIQSSRRVRIIDFLSLRLLIDSTIIVFLFFHFFISKFKGSPSESQREIPFLWENYKRSLGYGFPILFSSLFSLLLEFPSRYFLHYYLTISVVPTYVVSAKIASILSLGLITPFCLWWATERFNGLSLGDQGAGYFPIIANLFLSALIAASGVVWIFSDRIGHLLSPTIPVQSTVVSLMLLGGIFSAMAFPTNVGLLKEGNTHKNLYSVIPGAIAYFVLCLFLVPKWGLTGAGISTMTGSLINFVSFNFFSQRVHFVPFEYGRMFLMVTASIALLALVPMVIPWGNQFGFILQPFLFLLFVACFSFFDWKKLSSYLLNNSG